MTEAETARRVGEVVESASDRFVAQCYTLYGSPPLGAFVRAGSQGANGDGTPVYGVVYGVSTQSLDPGRPVIARGGDSTSEEAVYDANPQLSRLLCTRFEAVITGHSAGGSLKQYLPPLPPRIHSFVFECIDGEEREAARGLGFLSLLLGSSPLGPGMADEVIAACLRRASARQRDPQGFLVEAGKALAAHLSGDLARLDSILRRLRP